MNLKFLMMNLIRSMLSLAITSVMIGCSESQDRPSQVEEIGSKSSVLSDNEKPHFVFRDADTDEELPEDEETSDGFEKPSYMFGSPSYKWDQNTIAWRYNSAGQPSIFSTDTIIQSLITATKRWEAVCGISFRYDGITTDPIGTSGCDRKTVVGWGPLSGNTIGYAQVCYRNGGVLNELDLVLDNATPLQINSVKSMIQTATHEFGHGLGLGHSDSTAAIMYPVLRSDTLTEDDINGCQAIYGPPRGNPAPMATPPPTSTPRPPQATPVPSATPRPPQASPTPTPVATPLPSSACDASMSKAECTLFDRINFERARSGYRSLKVSAQCVAEARFHADEIRSTGVLSYDSPNESFTKRMNRFGLAGSFYAENISDDSSVDEVVTKWLGNRNNRAKILSSRYKSTGIGIATSTSGKSYVVQCLTSR